MCLKEIGLRAQNSLTILRDWIARSKFHNCARLNNQHNWEDLYDHLMSTGTFTLIMNKIFMCSKIYEEIGSDLFASMIRVVQFKKMRPFEIYQRTF